MSEVAVLRERFETDAEKHAKKSLASANDCLRIPTFPCWSCDSQ
jgi:hypothetical protein